MSKELPYFKFFIGEWLKGEITVCSMSAQGLFTNLCVYYWGKDCDMKLTSAQHRFNTCSTELEELIEMDIIGVEDGKIIINFLDEQFSEFGELRKKKSKAGKASAKIRKVNTSSTPVQHNPNKEDKIREDKEKINIEFDRFWNLYDKNVKRDICEELWNNLSDHKRELIIKHLPKYVKSTPDKQFRKNPGTYLEKESWKDEVIIGEKPAKQNVGDPLPEGYGVRSETATQMPASLKKRIKEIRQ